MPKPQLSTIWLLRNYNRCMGFLIVEGPMSNF
jgi:hypothetical protein